MGLHSNIFLFIAGIGFQWEVTTSQVLSTTPFSIQKGIGCGYRRVRAGEVLQIQSSNFGIGDYFNKELCIWRFFGHHCTLAAVCPCLDIPATSNCKEDYLKISDYFLYEQKFCGDVRPVGKYYSSTNNLRVRFRTNLAETAKGFMCFVFCTGPGIADPQLPPVVCPDGTTSGMPTGATSPMTMNPMSSSLAPNPTAAPSTMGPQ